LLFRARSFGGIKGEDNELLARKMFGRRRRNGKWETENGKWDMGHGESPRQKHANAFMWSP